MTKTCFIVSELYPLDLGGIGRLMHNIFLHSHAINPAAEIHVVMTIVQQPEHQKLIKHFAGIASLHFFPPDNEIAENLGLASLKTANSLRHLKDPALVGLRILNTVLNLQTTLGFAFDHIEIPDHMGVGAILIAAKKTGIAFEKTAITCRIHSTLSAIIAHEPFYHNRSEWLPPRVEMERCCLRDADRIIAHFPAIADFNQRHFDFPDNWRAKTQIAFPPAIWPVKTTVISPVDANADFIFTSRFQSFKRPELFIKAAITLLNKGSDYTGNFRLISYGFDQSYIDSLRLMVPPNWRGRIRININLPDEARESAIQSGIIVQPSAFESLCTLAFEVSSAGRPILLARDCLAFGDNPRWKDMENCLLFDPTPQDLAEIMEKSRHWKPISVVETTVDACYFHHPVKSHTALLALETATVFIGPLLSQNDFDSFAKADFGGFQKQGFASQQMLDRFAPDNPTKIAPLNSGDYCGAALRKMAGQTQTPVIFAAPDALPSREFIQTGLNCLRRGVVFSANSKTNAGQLNIYPGEMPCIAASDYRAIPLCFMLHPDDLAVISEHDDTQILHRLLARIVKSDLKILLCPIPLLTENAPLILNAPARNLIGFNAVAGWQNDVQPIAIDVKSAVFANILVRRPAGLLYNGKLGKFTVDISAKTPTLVSFQSKNALKGDILAVNIKNIGKAGAATVSLHQASAAISQERHELGQNNRVIRANQAYQMRWGPMMQDSAPVLVLSSTADTTLEIDEFLVISRE